MIPWFFLPLTLSDVHLTKLSDCLDFRFFHQLVFSKVAWYWAFLSSFEISCLSGWLGLLFLPQPRLISISCCSLFEYIRECFSSFSFPLRVIDWTRYCLLVFFNSSSLSMCLVWLIFSLYFFVSNIDVFSFHLKIQEVKTLHTSLHT